MKTISHHEILTKKTPRFYNNNDNWRSHAYNPQYNNNGTSRNNNSYRSTENNTNIKREFNNVCLICAYCKKPIHHISECRKLKYDENKNKVTRRAMNKTIIIIIYHVYQIQINIQQ